MAFNNTMNEKNALYENLMLNIINNLKIMNEYKATLHSLINVNFKNFMNSDIFNYHILYYDNKLYDTYLTVSSIKNNINKEIILQIIYNEVSNNLILFYKRGRIDENDNLFKDIKIVDKLSNNSGITYYNIFDINECINKFKKIFVENTGYIWDDYNPAIDYEKKINKYNIIKIKGLNDSKKTNILKKNNDNKVLDSNIIQFVKIVKLYHHNTEYTLYKLKIHNIPCDMLCNSINILNKIKSLYIDNLNDHNNEIIELTEEFTSIIPIICKNGCLTTIPYDYIDKFIKEIIDVSPYIVNDNININEIIYDINDMLIKIDKQENVYKLIETYVYNNHGPTHNNYNISIIDIFKYNIKNKNFINSCNNKYLFHGTRFSNIQNILQSGLKIAPKYIPRNGAMFGNGLYFANCSTKSFDYCMHDIYGNNCCILLCNVSLGNIYQTNKSYYIDSLKLNKLSCDTVYCPGFYTPDINQHINVDNISIPVGTIIKNKNSPSNNEDFILNYDEYVCYDTNRVQIEYVIYCKNK
tara:strand:+ start:4884 stop:6458 length:1575 start_codon:yes stop_codon:yes gene_type:complete